MSVRVYVRLSEGWRSAVARAYTQVVRLDNQYIGLQGRCCGVSLGWHRGGGLGAAVGGIWKTNNAV